jgi:hypothetical protein
MEAYSAGYEQCLKNLLPDAIFLAQSESNEDNDYFNWMKHHYAAAKIAHKRYQRVVDKTYGQRRVPTTIRTGDTASTARHILGVDSAGVAILRRCAAEAVMEMPFPSQVC